jgi:uncharacterized protein YsxB (DUF464 family)
MIEIDFPSPVGRQLKLKVSGHSNFDTKGKDIVCSAVSALLQTFISGVEIRLKGKLKGTFKAGDCDLSIEVSEEKSDTFKEVCEVFRYGFGKIAISYPEHVKMN